MDSAATLTAVAAIITAITGPLALVLVAHLNHKANEAAKTAKQLDEKVTHIDHAVNGKAPGAQSMVSQVADIHDEIIPPGQPPVDE